MKNKLVYRYILFLVGLFLNGFGVAFVTKASLGTTPIAAIPYTLSKIIPKLTLGNFTIIISILLILMQIIILRKNAKLIDIILQVPISLLFGYVIDFSMWLLSGFDPNIYILKFVSLLIGCLIIAFGAYCEVAADVTMLPADGFTRAIVKVSGMDFGNVKLITDSAQAVIALILGLVFLHKLIGVREGTIIGALLIGNIIKLIGKFKAPSSFFKTETDTVKHN